MRRTTRFGLLGLAMLLVLVFPGAAGAAGLSITSFSPSSGPVGMKVVLVGTGFAATDQVTIGGQAAPIVSATATHIHTAVPPFALTGPITVTNPAGLRVSSARAFRVSAGISASPKNVWRGGSLMLAGSALLPNATLPVRLKVGGTSQVLAEVRTDGNGDFNQPVHVSWGGKTGQATVIVREPNRSFPISILLIADWPTFHQDNLHQGVTSSVVNAGNASALVKKWSFATGGAVISSPAVANNVVYFGSEDGNLYALNATTGVLKWTYPVGATVSSPTVANGVVYIGTESGDLYAIDATSGSPDWVSTLEPIDAGSVTGSPEVANGTVYVSTTSSYLDTFILDATTGNIIRSFETDGRNQTMTVLSNGEVYLGDDGVTAFHLIGSTVVTDWWSNDYTEDTTAVVWSGRVYLGTDTGYLTSDTPGGENVYPTTQNTAGPVDPTWTFSTGTLNSVTSTPAVWNGDSYVASTDGHLYAVYGSGQRIWSLDLGGGPIDSSPAVANGVIYVGSENGSIYAVNQQTGAQLWSYATSYSIESSPAVANSIVYVGSDDGSLYAFALP
jgi:outer membrane protein assembly factor BamB